jgi:sortase A
MPGQVGNFAVAGHRVTHGQPFARLLDLNRGDKIVVETRTAIYSYVLDVAPRNLTVKSSDGWLLDPVPGKNTAPTKALLTLTTCQDLFRSQDRSVATGHLTSSTVKN